METLEFYLKNAQNAIKVFGNRRMLRDEDAISHVAYSMMHADEKYDGVTGSKEGYRWECARFAVLSIVSKKPKMKTVSLNKTNDEGASLCATLTRDEIPKKNIVHVDIVGHIESADYISSRDKQCLLDKYVNDLTLEEIGVKIGTTRERARQIIDEAIVKIRNHA